MNSDRPSRILVRGLNWLGDAVMSTAALLSLRERFPEAHITLLTPKKLAELWRHHPAVDEVVTFGRGEGVIPVSLKLREMGFDTALVLPNSPRSALEVWLARIPRRVGYARPWRNWFLTQLVQERTGAVAMRKRTIGEIKDLSSNHASRPASHMPYPPSAHHIHQYLHLVATLGANPEPLAPRLVVTDDELLNVAARFQVDRDTLWLGINSGAEYGPAKRWPIENYEFVTREAAAWPGWGVLLFGGKADAAGAGRIEEDFWKVARSWATRPQLVNLAGQTSLRELMALLKLCRVLLSNDSGPMHVAAAVGTPVVVPFGSTLSELTGPGLLGDSRHRLLKSDAPCAPCFRRECPIDFRCMNGITVERVVKAVLEVACR